MKRTLFKRLCGIAIVVTLLFQNLAGPGAMLVTRIVAEGTAQGAGDGATAVTPESSPTLEDATIPTVTKNPNNVPVNVEAYPIYSRDLALLVDTEHYDLVGSLGRWLSDKPGRSPYYVASISPWYYYTAVGGDGQRVQPATNLPYNEVNRYLFQPDLVVTNGTLQVPTTTWNAKGGYDFMTAHYVNVEHTYLRISATVLSGTGSIRCYPGTAERPYMVEGTVVDEPVELELDYPLTDYDHGYSFPRFHVTDGSMTDMAFILVDGTSPSVTRAETAFDFDSGVMTLTLTLNENLRWAHENVKKELDDIWVEVELSDLATGKKSPLRMYISELKGNRLIFTGELGDYKYKNFRVERISDAGMTKYYRDFVVGTVDVVTGMYISPYDQIQYGNEIQDGLVLNTYTTGITDHAGNPLDLLSSVNWVLNKSSYLANSFEIKEVEVFNEYTVSTMDVVETPAEDWPEDIDRAQLFTGPDNTMTLRLTTDVQLTEEEAAAVKATLNIMDKEGNPLTVACTSSYTYVPPQGIYDSGGGKTVTALLFEDISLRNCVGMDLMEGEIPQIRVVSIQAEIEGKEAYPHVQASCHSRTMYGDFDNPLVTGALLETRAPTEENAYHRLSAKLELSEDMGRTPYYAGVQTTKASIAIAGKVQEAVNIRYVISENPQAPEALEDYTETGVIPVNNSAYLATDIAVYDNQMSLYVHIIAESGGLLLDDVSLDVTVTDIVGNETTERVSLTWQIDEISPSIVYGGKTVEFLEGNTAARVKVFLRAMDYHDVVSLRYRWGEDTNREEEMNQSGETETGEATSTDGGWQTLLIEPGTTVNAEIERTFGGLDAEDPSATELLLVKVTDSFGNESEIFGVYVVVSTAKPETHVTVESDLNLPSTHPDITVSGPPALVELEEEIPAYTRVTISPNNLKETWEYAAVITTGDTIDLFSFPSETEGGNPVTWYKVHRKGAGFDRVTELGAIGEDPEWDLLLNYYGELKVSFENGYGGVDGEGQALSGLIPVEGQNVFDGVRGASYVSDPNYYVVRYASYNSEDRVVHKVDFGAVVDRSDTLLTEDGDASEDAFLLYNATKKNDNPMRYTRVSFTLSNLLRSDWGLMDIDFASSFVELRRVVGSDDRALSEVIATEQGLAGTETQYYSIPKLTDAGEEFVTGLYFVRVHVVSYSGRVDTYDSVSMLLDAETPQNDGLWEYTLFPYAVEYMTVTAEDEPFRSVGVSISLSHEVMRSNVFAVYSGGVNGFHLSLQAEENLSTYMGQELGRVAGFRYWNLLSDPTEEELGAQPFLLDGNAWDGKPTLTIQSRANELFTEETIPKGVAGFSDGYELYLTPGVNTICYQVMMENGYISPVRQIIVIVSDHLPEFNMAIEDYVPSHEAAQGEAATNGMVNAHSVSYFVEYAYSLNGSGEVDVRLYGTYDMEVILKGQEPLMTTDPTPLHDQLDLLFSGLRDEDTVILTEDSYTSDFDNSDYNIFCTAAFVAVDEYGGVTVVAPQLGEELRYGHSGATVDDRYNINYYDGAVVDPYTGEMVNYRYNEPVYYGAQITGFQNLLQGDDGFDVVMTSVPELKYNLFNISTNAIEWGTAYQSLRNAWNGKDYVLSSSVLYRNGNNFELINWDTAMITFSGGDLTEAVTVKMNYHGVNDAGFIEAGEWVDSDGSHNFSFSVASIPYNATTKAPVSMLFSAETVEADGLLYPQTIAIATSGEPNVLTFSSFDGVSLHYDDAVGKRAIVSLDAEGKVVTGLNYDGRFYSLTKDSAEEGLSGTYNGLLKSIKRAYTVDGYTIYGDYFCSEGTLTVYYTDYLVVGESATESVSDAEGYYGSVLYFTMDSMEHGNSIKTGMMNGGVYVVTLTDYYGNKHAFSYAVTPLDRGTEATFSALDPTSKPVTITLCRDDGKAIYVDIIDYGVMQVTGNGTSSVTVTVSENIVFSYRYLNDEDDEVTVKIYVKNIVQPAPTVIWSGTNLDEVTEYYGSLTVTLTDPSFKLIDRYTGMAPSFTFYPEGETSYVFSAADIMAVLGDEEVALTEDIRVELPVTLLPIPDPLGIYDPVTGERLEDHTSPNVQVMAYSNQNGLYTVDPLILRVVGSADSAAFSENEGFTVLEYVGNRGEATDLLAGLGWASAYRFEVAISDTSRTRLFIKEGLYGEAPDYETGSSDDVPGVKLYSRLLTVTSPSAFTLFVVDKENNATAIAFDVSNVGAAPLATALKVPMEDGRTVRVYALPPQREGIENFIVTSPDPSVQVLLDEDANSPYYGLYYAEYAENDDYELNYAYTYEGSEVTDILRTTVFEVNRREIALAPGGIKWSSNKALEATSSSVTVQITLTERVAELRTPNGYDESVVRYEISGNVVLLTYTDNHEALTLICVADNGSQVTVELDGVTNVDQSAPDIRVVSRELAANGKSLVLTLSSSERAVFREGSYVGTLGEDGLYYYTRTIVDNGTYVYHFTDMAGHETVMEIEITELVKDPLTAAYSLTEDGQDAVSDPSLLSLMVGDTIYVKPSRAVTAQLNDGEEMELFADAWTALVISSHVGGILPYLVMEDAFGNVLTHQFSQIAVPDGTPPVVAVTLGVIAVKAGTDRAEIEALLLSNFTAFDDDDAITYAVEFPEDVSLTGVFNVTYKATDSAGNVGVETGKLRILAGAEPIVQIDGTSVYRDATHRIKAGEDGMLTVDVEGRSYNVYIKSGIKTVAQMKIGSTVLAANATGTEPIHPGELASGYYTVCILTQDRDYFRLILYVE